MSVLGAFANPVDESQATYRTLLAALAEPFLPRAVAAAAGAPCGLGGAFAAACLTLLDSDTPVWLQPAFDPAARRWLRFHTRCEFVADPAQAQFALIGAPLEAPPLDAFNCGTITHPQSSTTLLWQVLSFEGGTQVRARGPGIERERALTPAGLPEDFWGQWARNAGAFPLGVDIFLFADAGVAGLPRTTRIDGGAP